MKASWTKNVGLASLLLGAVVLGAGCESQGPVERAGQKVDQGVQGVKDAISPPGPGEKAGRAVDNVLNK